jgi:hypothetical protein
MKKTLRSVWVGLFVLFILSACTRTVNNPNDNSNSNGGNNSSTGIGTTNGSITNGTWGISSFTERGESKTSDYAGTNFAFNTNGTVTASGAQNGTGNWSMSGSTLNLNFSSGRPLDRLNEPWKIVENTATVVRLSHPEANEDEHVTFTKK